MAEDAAGAVRRTPRPHPELAESMADVIRAEVGTVSSWHEAVQISCALLNAGWRPPHGPEPVDALNLALWLHAEAVWQREHARNLFIDHYNAASGTADRVGELETALRERTAERDALQARIDAALAETSSWHADGPPVPRDVLNRIRAALQGDQPAGPPDFAEVRGELADGRPFTGRVDLRPARELADRLEAASQPAGPLSEEDIRSLRFHLASVHKVANAFDLLAVDLEDVHQHDHFGPCGLRNHDVTDRSYDEAEARAVAAEADELTGEVDRG